LATGLLCPALFSIVTFRKELINPLSYFFTLPNQSTMKTLKKFIFIMAGICLLMTCSKSDDFFNNDSPDNDLKSSAVIKGEVVYDMSEQYFPCADEYFTGFVTVEYMITKNLYKERPFKVNIIGATSGNVYELSQTWKTNWYSFNGREATDVSTATIRLDGKLLALLHWTYHLTVNANGEVTVEFLHFTYDCH
jgi:hypothetical protein